MLATVPHAQCHAAGGSYSKQHAGTNILAAHGMHVVMGHTRW